MTQNQSYTIYNKNKQNQNIETLCTFQKRRKERKKCLELNDDDAIVDVNHLRLLCHFVPKSTT